MSPRPRTSALHRGILRAVLAVVSRPRLSLAVAGAALAACVLLAAFRLGISTSQNELFDPNVPFFRDYLRFIQIFPENEAVYVVVQARDPRGVPPVARWTALADAIAARLKSMPQYVKAVDARVPLDALGDQGLLFDDPARVRENFAGMKRFLPLARLWGEEPAALARVLGRSPMERFLAALRLQPPDPETAGFVAAVAEGWDHTVDDTDTGITHSSTGASPLRVGRHVPDLASLGATDPSRLGYYYVPDATDRSRSLLLVRVYENTRYTSLTAISETVESIRSAVADVARGFPEFTTGVTGRPALEADEMRTSDRDSHRAEVVALAAVFVGLVLMLRSWWLALAGEIALGVGIGWTFGWATLSVGRLNLLSIVFLLALIGIGMDYLVQILTRYRQEALRRSAPRTIWAAVFRHVAAPINTACAGAAGAFLVSALTRFRGAAQLGVIAGGGLLLCLLAGYVVLPALLTLLPPKFARRTDPAEAEDFGPPARVTWRTFVLPALWVALLLAGIPFAMRTGFDPGLISMQAPNLESVKLVDKLETWSAVVLSRDLETLRRARSAVRESPVVERTESILQAYDNLDWLRQHEAELPQVRWAPPAPITPEDLPRLAALAELLARRFFDAPPATTAPASTTVATTAPSNAFADAAGALLTFAGKLRGVDGPAAARLADRLTEWEAAFVAQLQSVLAPFHPRGLDVSKLPPELKGHFVAPDGTYALYVYPRANLWEHANLEAFVRDVEPRVAGVPGDHTFTGIAPNIFHTTASIKTSFRRATAYALGLIFVLVLLDLRRLRQTLFAVSVLALGLPMLVALMGLLGVDWNFANFFGLPILIGAGHEYGVFLVHRYREAVADPRRVWRRWDVSDRALLLCAYVTTASFGFFWMLAHHRGLKSLGLVMALGTACVYLSAVLVLRPLLLWRLSRAAGTGT